VPLLPIIAAAVIMAEPAPKPPPPRLLLASVHVGVRGPWHVARTHPTGGAPPPPPPPAAQFFFPTGKDLILLAATSN
jgi:hypothetical protein